MQKEHIYLYDTTLRDGQQTLGVDFNSEEKTLIANALSSLGLDYIEGGFPGANPTDTNFFAQDPDYGSSKLTAFGMTRRAGRSASNDPGLAALLDSRAQAICVFGKTWDLHVEVALGISNEENLAAIADTLSHIAADGREALFDCEHFFDGYKANRDFALACAKTAYENGARWVVLCDTNGGTLSNEIEDIVRDVMKVVPGDHLGIHCHDDTGQAVANSLAAVRAGVRQIQGTLNGLGERCGNANLTTIIPTLMLKPTFSDRFTVSVTHEQLKNLTYASRTLDEVLNRAPDRSAAYVGDRAFSHKGGIHVSAVQKNPKTYEHVLPELVGNRRRMLVSDQAGKSNIIAELERLNIKIDKNDPRIGKMLQQVKAQEAEGYAYEGADASFELLARRILFGVPEFYKVEHYRVLVERRYNALGHQVNVSEATVKVTVHGKTYISAAEGNGPVNALDIALRKDLGQYSPHIKNLELVDYKVRILNGGTEAVTRVLIESRDETGSRWMTVGVSSNIVDASFAALSDSITYKLIRDQAPIAAQ
ncbi:MAG: citramalate synthase [Hyphomicrobiales bacterium]|nr:MAG: citramalate synthase [Hyphomicrobiales bacterium]